MRICRGYCVLATSITASSTSCTSWWEEPLSAATSDNSEHFLTMGSAMVEWLECLPRALKVPGSRQL